MAQGDAGGRGVHSADVPRAGIGWGRCLNDRDRVGVRPQQEGKPGTQAHGEGSPTAGTTGNPFGGSEEGGLCPAQCRKGRQTNAAWSNTSAQVTLERKRKWAGT